MDENKNKEREKENNPENVEAEVVIEGVCGRL